MQASYDDFDGELLRKARTGRGTSLAELSRATELPVRELARYEAGRELPAPEVIRAIAVALRLSPYCFIDPDVTVMSDEVEVLHRPGETREEWSERFQAASPPLSAEAKAAIRAAGDEYWMSVRASRKRREPDEEPE